MAVMDESNGNVAQGLPPADANLQRGDVISLLAPPNLHGHNTRILRCPLAHFLTTLGYRLTSRDCRHRQPQAVAEQEAMCSEGQRSSAALCHQEKVIRAYNITKRSHGAENATSDPLTELGSTTLHLSVSCHNRLLHCMIRLHVRGAEATKKTNCRAYDNLASYHPYAESEFSWDPASPAIS